MCTPVEPQPVAAPFVRCMPAGSLSSGVCLHFHSQLVAGLESKLDKAHWTRHTGPQLRQCTFEMQGLYSTCMNDQCGTLLGPLLCATMEPVANGNCD
jgi:hypothetical protein